MNVAHQQGLEWDELIGTETCADSQPLRLTTECIPEPFIIYSKLLITHALETPLQSDQRGSVFACFTSFHAPKSQSSWHGVLLRSINGRLRSRILNARS